MPDAIFTRKSTETLGDRILKVDHAGEHGAVNIYAGQIAVARLLHRPLVGQLEEFQVHERRHRAVFAAELSRRGRGRCRSYHLCGAGGFLLGLVSGLLGRSAIAATTVAVEQVVLGHLSEQIEQLKTIDEPAAAALRSIRDDEQSHHDLSLHQIEPGKLWGRLLFPIVAGSTEAVIWIGMQL
jgi:ubiquinone biosynthesis monooxygenase Coq7